MRRHTLELGLGLGLILGGFAVFAAACTTNNNTVVSPDGGTTTNPDGSTTPTGDGGTTNPDGGEGGITTPAKAIHAVTGAADNERITGIYCTSATTCVAGTDMPTTGTNDNAHIYSVGATTVGTTPVFTSDDTLSNTAGVIGQVTFLGFAKAGDKLIAMLDAAGTGFVSASGDPTVPANWSAVSMGVATPTNFALNAQYGFGLSGTTWIQVRNSFVYKATAAPAPATGWTTLWSPGGSQDIPVDLKTQHATDPSLCLSQVAYSFSPRPTQAAYTASDASLIIYSANGLNDTQTDDAPGVCISTDLGASFHIAKFPGLAADIDGPTAMTCTSKDHCVAAGGQVFVDNTVYVYTSNNASQGKSSTWTKATIPTPANNQVVPFNIFFAPDGTTGWLVGTSNAGPLLWTTTDGGATWTDQTSTVTAFTDRKLWSGFAVDSTHYIIGGELGVILSTF